MKTSHRKIRPHSNEPADEIVPVLKQIARRADELWTKGERGHGHGRDLEYWLQAEREVFGEEIIYSFSQGN